MANLHFKAGTQLNLKQVSEIIPNLYLGNKIILEEHSDYFDLIINCTPDIKIPIHEKYDNSKTYYIRLPVKDDPFEAKKLYDLLHETQALLEIERYLNRGQKVLVHCTQGIQRSCAVVACYLIKYKLINAMEAVEFVRRRRPIAFFGSINFIETIDLIYKDRINKIVLK